MSYLIRNRYGPVEFDKEETVKFAKLLADPSNTITFVSSKSFEGLAKTEKWYNVSYENEKYSENLMNLLCKPQVANNGLKLDLPEPNPLLPGCFDIACEN